MVCKVIVVPIVLSVAVDGVRVVIVHVAPRVEAAAVVAVLAGIAVVPVVVVVVVVDGPLRFWRDVRAYCCS